MLLLFAHTLTFYFCIFLYVCRTLALSTHHMATESFNQPHGKYKSNDWMENNEHQWWKVTNLRGSWPCIHLLRYTIKLVIEMLSVSTSWLMSISMTARKTRRVKFHLNSANYNFFLSIFGDSLTHSAHAIALFINGNHNTFYGSVQFISVPPLLNCRQ